MSTSFHTFSPTCPWTQNRAYWLISSSTSSLPSPFSSSKCEVMSLPTYPPNGTPFSYQAQPITSLPSCSSGPCSTPWSTSTSSRTMVDRGEINWGCWRRNVLSALINLSTKFCERRKRKVSNKSGWDKTWWAATDHPLSFQILSWFNCLCLWLEHFCLQNICADVVVGICGIIWLHVLLCLWMYTFIDRIQSIHYLHFLLLYDGEYDTMTRTPRVGRKKKEEEGGGVDDQHGGSSMS